MAPAFEESKDAIARLVKHFATNREQYCASDYKEAHARQEFIDPLFVALGWDVANTQQAAPNYREVVVEDSLEIEGQKKAPDYVFRVGRERKFFAEAKKPGIDLKISAAPAYQLRRYAWTAKLPLSLLTDFDELAVYDCRVRPSEKDKASAARVNYLTFAEYPDRWREVWDVFSREAVWGGSFDQYALTGKGKRGTSTVDAEFLKEIEGWREALAHNLALRNPHLTVDELCDSVQRTIDRIIFLRMAEDRGIEEYGRLQRLIEKEGIYRQLTELFRHADRRYNSGLFDFSKSGDRLTPSLNLDDRTIKNVLVDLYFPQSPYEFSVLPVEILGNVYEQFLGKVIRLTPGHQAKVEEKPEVRRAGGVYYTPAYIVAYIVENTVGALVEGRSPAQLKGFRVLDPACGSGSFLLGAYQFLLDYYVRWYTANSPEKHKKAVYRLRGVGANSADWHLTSAEKRRILTEHIFGVDIDRQAVEVTKLSLLLKVLETESGVTLTQQLTLLPGEAQERALPNLDQNIKCGNSLIGPDYFSGRLLPDAEELARVNPFEWKAAFPEAIAAGGFDAVIGNPPYIRIQTLKEWAPLEVEAYKELYRSARSGNFDIYVVFVEKGLSLLNKTGHLGFILPHKFLKAEYGRPLRTILAEGRLVSQIVHFGDQQVFDGATTYTCLLFLDRRGAESFTLARVPDVRQLVRGAILPGDTVSAGAINEDASDHAQENRTSISERRECQRLEEMAHVYQGVATSADSVYVLEVVQKGPRVTLVTSRELGAQVRIETSILLHLLKGSEIRRYEIADPINALLFPYNLEERQAVLLSRRDLEARYPLALEYLERCKAKLLQRSKVDPRVYWHYPYPKNLVMYQRPKILVQVLSARGAFAADLEGRFCFLGGGTAGGNAIHLRDAGVDQYLNLLGILNSRYTTHFVSRVGSEFRGGYYSFGKGSIGGLPVPIIDLADPADKARHDKMTALVERMLELHRRRQAAGSDHERELLQRQIDATDGEIDALVYELYGLTAEEIAVIEAAIK